MFFFLLHFVVVPKLPCTLVLAKYYLGFPPVRNGFLSMLQKTMQSSVLINSLICPCIHRMETVYVFSLYTSSMETVYRCVTDTQDVAVRIDLLVLFIYTYIHLSKNLDIKKQNVDRTISLRVPSVVGSAPPTERKCAKVCYQDGEKHQIFNNNQIYTVCCTEVIIF